MRTGRAGEVRERCDGACGGVTAAITAAPAATIITAPHRDTPNCIIHVSLVSYLFVCECGGMVDALSSGGSECMLVGVQLPPLARMENPRKTLERQRSGVFSYMPDTGF